MTCWSEREIERLCEMVAEDYDFDLIAKAMCRGVSEVRVMWARLVRVMGS